MSEPREQLNRIQRALDSALAMADLIDRAYDAATGHELQIPLRIASQDVGAVIALLRSAETAQEGRL